MPILEHLDTLTPRERARAEAIMLRHERAAIARATLADGCADLLGPPARRREIPIAILTRNVREVVETFARMFTFRFHAVYTREDGPPKPSPRGRAVAVPRDGRRAGADARGRRLQVRRDGGARRRLPDRAGQPRRRSRRTSWSDWGSPDLVVKSLRELLPLFAR